MKAVLQYRASAGFRNEFVNHAFVESIRCELGIKLRYRDVDEADGTFALHDPQSAWTTGFGTENVAPRLDHVIFGRKLCKSRDIARSAV